MNTYKENPVIKQNTLSSLPPFSQVVVFTSYLVIINIMYCEDQIAFQRFCTYLNVIVN